MLTLSTAVSAASWTDAQAVRTLTESVLAPNVREVALVRLKRNAQFGNTLGRTANRATEIQAVFASGNNADRMCAPLWSSFADAIKSPGQSRAPRKGIPTCKLRSTQQQPEGGGPR